MTLSIFQAASAIEAKQKKIKTLLPADVDKIAEAAANEFSVDPVVFKKLIYHESGGNPNAQSPVGAYGYAQLMPDTAKGLGVDPKNPSQNMRGGAKYLKQMLNYFNGDYVKAVAAYNAGPGNVEKYGGIPPFKETQNYVKNILGADYGKKKKIFTAEERSAVKNYKMPSPYKDIIPNMLGSDPIVPPAYGETKKKSIYDAAAAIENKSIPKKSIYDVASEIESQQATPAPPTKPQKPKMLNAKWEGTKSFFKNLFSKKETEKTFEETGFLPQGYNKEMAESSILKKPLIYAKGQWQFNKKGAEEALKTFTLLERILLSAPEIGNSWQAVIDKFKSDPSIVGELEKLYPAETRSKNLNIALNFMRNVSGELAGFGLMGAQQKVLGLPFGKSGFALPKTMPLKPAMPTSEEAISQYKQIKNVSEAMPKPEPPAPKLLPSGEKFTPKIEVQRPVGQKPIVNIKGGITPEQRISLPGQIDENALYQDLLKNPRYRGILEEKGIGSTPYTESKPVTPPPKGLPAEVKPVVETPVPVTQAMPKPAAKEPWQMTRGEFKNNYLFRGQIPTNEIGKKPTSWFTKSEQYAHEIADQKVSGVKGQGKVFVVNKQDVLNNLPREKVVDATDVHFNIGNKTVEPISEIPINKDAHTFIIKQALSEGKPVPAEVLKDYPELVKQAAISQTTPQPNLIQNIAKGEAGAKGISPSVVKTIEETKAALTPSGEKGAVNISNLANELDNIVEKTSNIGKQIGYAFKSASAQMPKSSFFLKQQLNKQLSKNIESTQALVGEKLTNPKVTKLLENMPYISKEKAQSIAKNLRNIPFYGKNFGVSGAEQKQLFKLAESIKSIDKNGNPVFGTLKQTGETRFTAEEGQALWDSARPIVKQAALDFAKPYQQAKDIFNRNIAKEFFNIKSDVEGYVRHMGFKEKPFDSFKKIFLNFRKAGAKQLRTEAKGYTENFENATIEGLTNLLNTKDYNKFVVKFEESITEAITKQNPLKKGWTRAKGKFGSLEGKDIQIPNTLYDQYKRYVEPAKDYNEIQKTLNTISNYYKSNLLVHAGSTATNAIGQATLFGAKVLDDFYGFTLSGKIEPLANDFRAIFSALSSEGVKKTPSYLWGEATQVAAFVGESNGFLRGAISKLLIPFQAVDTFAKRMVYTAEAMTKLGIKEFRKADAEKLFNLSDDIVKQIDDAVDLYALNYTNVPKGLEKFRESPASFLVAPFPTYYYKYAQHVSHYIAALNPTIKMTAQDRATRILTLTTLIGLNAYINNKEEKKSPEYIGEKRGVTAGMPWQYQTTGRTKIGEDEKGEAYLRGVKYPWASVYQLLRGLTELASSNSVSRQKGGNRLEQLKDEATTLGPGFALFDIITGHRSKYEQYTPTDVLAGKTAKTFIPFFRVTEGAKNAIYPEKKTPQNFFQALAGGLPVEPQGKPVKKGIKELDPQEEWSKFWTGINIRHIKPSEAKKERNKVIQRIKNNLYNNSDWTDEQKRQARQLLKDINELK